jgi:hypothetical protein
VLLGHMMIFGVAQAISGGATATMFAEMFSTGVRYTGASVGYQSRHVTTIDQKYDAVATYPSDPDYAEHDRVNRELYDEAYQIIKGLWENREFAMKGHHWQVPPDGIRWDHPATRAMAPSLVDDSGNLQKIGIAPNRTGRGFIAARPTRSVLPFTGVLPEELDSFPRIQLGGIRSSAMWGRSDDRAPHVSKPAGDLQPNVPATCATTPEEPADQLRRAVTRPELPLQAAARYAAGPRMRACYVSFESPEKGRRP